MPDPVADDVAAPINTPPSGPRADDTPPQSPPERTQDEIAEDREIMREAQERFDRVQAWESLARMRWMADYKFANGDADNSYQWPDAIRRSREVDQRPCLTINKTRQHNLQIINDAKKNKPGIKIRATGGGASVQSAKIYNAIMRHIEYESNATVAYDTATTFQVHAGKGYLRLVTDYIAHDSDKQAPYIRRVNDPLTVYMDPDAREADKTDARWAFVFEDVPKEDFDEAYPQYASIAGQGSIVDSSSWTKDDYVRIAEYFRRVARPDTLYLVPVPGADDEASFFESELERYPEMLERIRQSPGVRSRPTQREIVEYFVLVGDRIAERSTWPGKYVPLIPVVGEESVIQGQYDCKGHTRALKDPQHMYNWMSSAAVECTSLQSKSPWIAPAEAIEGYETYWNTANTVNHSVLPYNGLRDDGTPIPAPERQTPPVPMPAAITGMQVAANEMAMASGQYADSMGERSNERSAKAINERQRMGDTATYHYIDNLAIAVRAVGKMLLDLVPKLYDTQRILHIMAEDGTALEVQINPQLGQAMQVQLAQDGQSIERVLFNPNVGRYEVQADIGPSWGTKREEMANAMTLILTQAPQFAPILADLLVKNLDFDGAEEAADRLRRMVPPQAMGLGPSVQEQNLMAQVQNLQGLLSKTFEQLTIERTKLRGKDALREIDAHHAATDRLTDMIHAATEQGVQLSPELLKKAVRNAEVAAEHTSLVPVTAASEPALAAAAAPSPNESLAGATRPPVQGARRGADGHWYAKDYGGHTGWVMIE